MLFLERLVANGRRQPAKVALALTGPRPATVTYGELLANVDQTMAYLRALGVQRGDRIALQLPKDLPFIYLHLATMRLGAISLPLNTAYPAGELAYYLKDSGAVLFFADDRHRATYAALSKLTALRQLVFIADTADFDRQRAATSLNDSPIDPPGEHDTALMIYTSGTTGRPKGAELTHANLTANLDSLHVAWGWRDDDVLLHVLPIYHLHGLSMGLHGALHAGATAILQPDFDVDAVLAGLQDPAHTVFMAVPTIYRRLVNALDGATVDLSHLRLMTSGSDRLPDDLFSAAQTHFGYTLLERYGMSETGINLSNPLEGERRLGSVGRPLPNVQVRIVDPATDQPLPDGEVGEVQIKGAHVFKGYWRRPEQTAAAFTADGWLRSGDLGLREEDGYFSLKGRSKDLVISGGLNVYPPEVERVLLTHPDVAAAAVIGCPDAEWGERVTAVIVPAAGCEPGAERLIAFCRTQLAPYKAPRRVILVDDLPRNMLGKIQKARLRELICGAGDV